MTDDYSVSRKKSSQSLSLVHISVGSRASPGYGGDRAGSLTTIGVEGKLIHLGIAAPKRATLAYANAGLDCP